MPVTPKTELMYLKGVGPRRAEILAKRGLRTFEDLLGYLPFRYEDRIHFAKIRDVRPGQTYTLLCASLQRQPGAILALARRHVSPAGARDDTGSLPCKFFFTDNISTKTFKPGQGLVLHGESGAGRGAARPRRND